MVLNKSLNGIEEAKKQLETAGEFLSGFG